MEKNTELQTKIKQVQKLIHEIVKSDEFRTAVKQIGEARLAGKQTTRGACFNGCAACLPCLATPTPDLEFLVGFTINEFY